VTEEEQILMEVLDCQRIDLYLNRFKLNPDQKRTFRQMLERRAAGEPLQYIIGHCNFMGLKIFVDERVLIPRPETELLVEHIINISRLEMAGRPLRVLDLGTGSGNIAITLAKNIDRCEVTAVEISEGAIDLARQNAIYHNVDRRIRFIHEDMMEFLKETGNQEEKYDIVVSNPPYISSFQISQLPVDVQYEPKLALDGGEDGLDFYRYIISFGYKFLRQEGLLIGEIADGQSSMIYSLFEYVQIFDNVQFYKDYTRTNRIVVARFKDKQNYLFDSGFKQNSIFTMESSWKN